MEVVAKFPRSGSALFTPISNLIPLWQGRKGGMEIDKDQQINRIWFQTQEVTLWAAFSPSVLFPSPPWLVWKGKELGSCCIFLFTDLDKERLFPTRLAQEHPIMLKQNWFNDSVAGAIQHVFPRFSLGSPSKQEPGKAWGTHVNTDQHNSPWKTFSNVF